MGITLHYQNIYPDGFPLLGEITTFLIKGNYLKERYNLKDEITQEQLSPLLEGYSPTRQEEILQNWQGTYPLFKIISAEEERRKREGSRIL